jgi:MFS family permease
VAGTTTDEEDTVQERLATASPQHFDCQSVNYSSRQPECMATRATISFVFSIIGSSYQMASLFLGVLVDRTSTPFYYTISYQSLFLAALVSIWSASHLLEDWKGRITWPSIILGIGVASLSIVLVTYYIQATPLPIYYSTPPSIPATIALIFGPILNIIGGLLGFWAVRQYSREHGRAVLAHT